MPRRGRAAHGGEHREQDERAGGEVVVLVVIRFARPRDRLRACVGHRHGVLGRRDQRVGVEGADVPGHRIRGRHTVHGQETGGGKGEQNEADDARRECSPGVHRSP
jgi:hypothetical protein